MRPAMLVVLQLLCAWVLTNQASAQTWSLTRSRPSLFEIIAVDATADELWPWGREDLAGDGDKTLRAEEAELDLRSLYASVRADRLWLRTYVTAKTQPDAKALFVFFIDTDANVSSGGKAEGMFGFTLGPDPSAGGYERAIVVDGSRTVDSVYTWNKEQKRWDVYALRGQLVFETGVARDPLRLLGDDHGYAQVQLSLEDAGIQATCLSNIFVRSWLDAPQDNDEYGDAFTALAVSCHPRLNRFGDPYLLGSDSCSSAATCPGAGSCLDGICVFGYECNGDDACASGQRCTGNVCVRVVDRSCSSTEDCDGLVCEASACIACSANGAGACEEDLVCVNDGRCLDPSTPGTSGGPAAVSGGGDGVRGGAFRCALTRAAGTADTAGWWLVSVPLSWFALRRRRARKHTGGAS